MTEIKQETDTTETGAELPRAELDVLGCLWQHGEATARQLREAMMGYRPMAHGSMVTLLCRLEDKGLLTKRKAPVGKAFIFTPTQRPEPTYRKILKNLLHRLFGGDGVCLVASLFEGQPPTHEELDELQKLIDDHRQKQEESDADRAARDEER